MSKKIYISWEETKGMCMEIARQMYVDNWYPDYIVGLTRGGLSPAVLLSQYLNTPMHTLRVSLRDSAIAPEHIPWMVEDAAHSKDILIVDDINDSGETLNWIVRDWTSTIVDDHHSPVHQSVFGDTVRIATLVDNIGSSYDNIDYAAMEIDKREDDLWIIFPWEDWWKSSKQY